MRLFRTSRGAVVERDSAYYPLGEDWDSLVNRVDLPFYLGRVTEGPGGSSALDGRILAPIAGQEVWAAGVTYTRSRAARLEEAKIGGGGDFYDRVYEAERPELFFKSAPWRVRGPGDTVRIRQDAQWSVPEPEVALYINSRAEIVGYTIGNDMSSRDIEGENPLYLPQAKIYNGSCALGPAVLVNEGTNSLPASVSIDLRVTRNGVAVFEGRTSFSQMRRDPRDLVRYLFRETSFPHGCVLLTGTGIVPPDDFTLCAGDSISILVPAIGTLENTVADA
ncbi:MAG TPA: fumarylacetoacetate hydrolase family protein [Gemmatimonadaceae bacterium]|nr:fumarylacetoacetate hydrolase family protein [Gemmatimonadaceae bacterium]